MKFYLDNFFQKLSFLLVFESLRLTDLDISFLVGLSIVAKRVPA